VAAGVIALQNLSATAAAEAGIAAALLLEHAPLLLALLLRPGVLLAFVDAVLEENAGTLPEDAPRERPIPASIGFQPSVRVMGMTSAISNAHEGLAWLEPLDTQRWALHNNACFLDEIPVESITLTLSWCIRRG
jgi:hypothetical protein